MHEVIVPVEWGYRPEAAVSGELLLAVEGTAWLLFNAVALQSDGLYKYVGTATVNFSRCQATRFGYPNDEGRFADPVLRNLPGGYGIFEVRGSSWIASLLGNHSEGSYRHFIVSLHDSTFECIAKDVLLQVTRGPFETALQHITARIFLES